MLASLLSVLLVRWLYEPIPGFSTLVLRWVGLGGLFSLLGIYLTGSYKIVRRWATIRTVYRLAGAVLLKEFLLSIMAMVGFLDMPTPKFTILALLIDMLITFFVEFLLRFTGRVIEKNATARSIPDDASRRNVLIAGTGPASVELASNIDSQPGYNVIGFVSSDPEMEGRVIRDYIVYKCDSTQELEDLEWRLGGVDCLFFPRPGEDFWMTGKRKDGAADGKSVRKLSKGSQIPVHDPMSTFGKAVKRTFDFTLSALLLIVFSPLGLICALAIKLEDGGPVLFRQERIGKGGSPFKIVKFRSMRIDAEAMGAQLAAGENDPRLTRTGRFLRKHHLDELPQFWNVLCGDMSFIGYRPERTVYIEKIMEVNPRYRYLYQIRPGVTSYATLYNGYTDTIEKMMTRLDLDLYYLRNHSLLFDAKVLGLTFLRIIFGKVF